MAKADNPVSNDAPVVVPVGPTDTFQLGIDEFCSRLSQNDKRIEMIGAFNHIERLAGTTTDTAAAFTARYTAFVDRPV